MDTLPEKKKLKRASHGSRKHIRRMKQEARKNNVPETVLKKRTHKA